MSPINICFVTDEKYAPYTGVAIYSVLHHANKQTAFHFYIFDNGISKDTKQKLQQLMPASSRLSFIDVSSCQTHLAKLQQTTLHITKTSYLKFFIADLLPQLDKIIYLDGDLVAFGDVTPLWDIDLKGNLFAAVEDVGYTCWSKYRPEFKLKFKCINTGVMLIDCKKWRDVNLSKQLLDCAVNHDKVGLGQDQPVFNFVCKDKILFLPFEWNVQDTFFRNEMEILPRPDVDACHRAVCAPRIIHYTCLKKPWDYPFMRQANTFWGYYVSSGLCPKNALYKYKIYKPFMRMNDKFGKGWIYLSGHIKTELWKLKHRLIKDSK